MADAIRDLSLGRDGDYETLIRLGFAEEGNRGPLLARPGREFDDAWTVYRDRDAATELLRDALLALPATQALIQGLHGRVGVTVPGALHLLARLGHADPDDPTAFRIFLRALNDVGIVAYSNKQQIVRLTAMPGSKDEQNVPEVSVRIVQPERPYTNIRNLREIIRSGKDYVWWADPHFGKKGFEPLADEADASKIKEIRILSGPAQSADATKDYTRFQAEMKALGINVEWRIVQTADRTWHDRYIISRDAAWNVPPINTIYKNDYSEFSRTDRPPFEDWWKKGTPLT